ncbi:37S ribosomal protein S24, mitochondrial [Trapelia coarctata]|nr:37S ribosomal protein S24, mitochondrial [Trapelia coarctata]
MQTLRLTAIRGTYRIRPRRPIADLLPLASTNTHSFHTIPNSQASSTGFASTLPERARAFYESLSPEDKDKYERVSYKIDRHMSSPAVESRLNAKMAHALQNMPAEEPGEAPERFKGGLMSMGEVDEFESGEDELFEGDDMSSIAHGELEQHRELREYARIAAWEMPLLSKLATPFEPPTSSTPLRFRHTSYLGETHPAANKIVLEFTTADLPLKPSERLILIKLLGVRYDPQKDLAKLSCEMFETAAQNKRYLGDLVDTLMSEARERDANGAGEGGDRFSDVPCDFRHVRWKNKPTFPEEWKLSKERRAELESRRKAAEQAEQKRIELGEMVDGAQLIEDAVRAATLLQPAAAPISNIIPGRGGGAVGREGRRGSRS